MKGHFRRVKMLIKSKQRRWAMFRFARELQSIWGGVDTGSMLITRVF